MTEVDEKQFEAALSSWANKNIHMPIEDLINLLNRLVKFDKNDISVLFSILEFVNKERKRNSGNSLMNDTSNIAYVLRGIASELLDKSRQDSKTPS